MPKNRFSSHSKSRLQQLLSYCRFWLDFSGERDGFGVASTWFSKVVDLSLKAAEIIWFEVLVPTCPLIFPELQKTESEVPYQKSFAPPKSAGQVK